MSCKAPVAAVGKVKRSRFSIMVFFNDGTHGHYYYSERMARRKFFMMLPKVGEGKLYADIILCDPHGRVIHAFRADTHRHLR